MAESGLYYFRIALQEMNEREAAKRRKREAIANRGMRPAQLPSPLPKQLPPCPPPLPPFPSPPPSPALKKAHPPERSRFSIRPACISFLPANTSPGDNYDGAVCLLHSLTELFPAFREVLVDAEDLERLSAYKWGLVRSSNERGLRVTNSQGKYLHVIVMNPPNGMVVDHKAHRTLDNRKSQLRICTTRENNINRQPRAGKASKFKGVGRSARTGKWFVHAGPRSGRVFIGGFESEVEAALAYNDLARRLYGSMAYQNSV